MSFQTPKGEMVFRKEDHQALQSMFVFKNQGGSRRALGHPRSGQGIDLEKTWRFRSILNQ